MPSNNGGIIKNVVLESKMLNNGSDDEIIVEIEISDEVVVVDEKERVCEERLSEYTAQRANFPWVINGVKTPHVVYEDKEFRDIVSQSGPLICCDVPGKARKCFNDFVVPFARTVSYTHLDVYKRQI